MKKTNPNNFRLIVEEIHPLYDFSNTEYINNKTKVSYNCLKHGLQKSYPFQLLNGNGCSKCGQERTAKSVRLTTELFIKKAKKIHGEKYCYDKVNYSGSLKKVSLKCNACNTEFCQMANTHFRNDGGCPTCKKEKSKKQQSENPVGWGLTSWDKLSKTSKQFDSFKVYIIECYNESERFIKIGRTFQKVKQRFNNKEVMPYNFKILELFTFETAKETFDFENKLKKKNKPYKYEPLIWFQGRQECFTEYLIDK